MHQNQQISNRGLQYAAQCLDVNSFITEINFSHNMIGADGIMEFAEVLERNTSLTSIDLSFNPAIGIGGGNPPPGESCSACWVSCAGWPRP